MRIPLLRLVPDNTNLDFFQFRRFSFPVSAILSLLAVLAYFHYGLNLGIDFKGGTLIEVQSKTPKVDIAAMRTTLEKLQLGEIQLQQFGDNEVLIRVAQQPGGDQAQQEVVAKVRGALGESVEYRRVEVVGPRVSAHLLG